MSVYITIGPLVHSFAYKNKSAKVNRHSQFDFCFEVRLGTCETGSFKLLIVPRRYFCGGSYRFVSWC